MYGIGTTSGYPVGHRGLWIVWRMREAREGPDPSRRTMKPLLLTAALGILAEALSPKTPRGTGAETRTTGLRPAVMLAVAETTFRATPSNPSPTPARQPAMHDLNAQLEMFGLDRLSQLAVRILQTVGSRGMVSRGRHHRMDGDMLSECRPCYTGLGWSGKLILSR